MIGIWADALFSAQVVDLDLLCSTELNLVLAVLFLCLILTQRPMTDGKIGPSDEHCFGLLQVVVEPRSVTSSHEITSSFEMN